MSTDALRALVGEGDHDQRAGTDAFAVLDDVLERRLRRRLLTVIDSLGLEPARRRAWLALARRHGLPCHAVTFSDAAGGVPRPQPAAPAATAARVVTGQLRALRRPRWRPSPTRASTACTRRATSRSCRRGSWRRRRPPPAERDDPLTLRFGLQIPAFTWEGGPAELAARLGAIAAAAEDAGFASLWVMDHVLQIPFIGREWLDMLDSYTTLGFLAGRTSRIRLGTMVTGITYRNVAHLAKIVATLDVLSGGRAMCGLGAAWFEREHKAYGWPFPPLGERYALLEDALQLLPLMWGPGAPPFEGQRLRVAEAICYPRPLQEHVPILVGGQGERRTLRLVARYADACNLRGDPPVVAPQDRGARRALRCLRARPRPPSPSPTSSTALVGPRPGRASTPSSSASQPKGTSPEAYRTWAGAGTVEDQVGRFRELAEPGVARGRREPARPGRHRRRRAVRRRDRRLPMSGPPSWVAPALAAAPVARLATTGIDGTVHLVPFCFAVVGDRLVSAVDHKPKRHAPPPAPRRHRGDRAGVGARRPLRRRLVAAVVDPGDRAGGRGARRHRARRRRPAALAAKYHQYREHPPAGPV